MLTDSYKIIKEGYVSLSGKSVGVSGVAADVISSLTGGEVSVEFKAIDDYAKSLAEKELGKEYVENPEGFIIEIGDKATVYADTDRAKLYGACAIKDKYKNGKITKGVWWNYPSVPHRSIRIFLPPKDDMDYFYKLMDMLVHLGYNAILLEIGGAMEFKRHPEINEGWLKYCASANESPEKYKLVGKTYRCVKNSVHTCNAGGGVYSQEEMKDIVKYCADRFIDIIPEVPSLTHSEYITVSHPELQECPDEPYGSAACPSNPELNKLVFDLYDEVIDVFGCKDLHIGHDEWWVMCLCDKCKDKDPTDLYVNNVLESYNYLKSKGVKTHMWADKMHKVVDKEGESHGASEKHVYSTPTKRDTKSINIMGKDLPLYDHYWYKAPEWVKKEGYHQVIRELNCAGRLPNDISFANWYYAVDPDIEKNIFYQEGKDMYFGNALPSTLNNYKMRFKYGSQGISVSNWAETSEANMQQWGSQFEVGYGSIICWNHSRDELDFEKNVFEAFNGLYELRNYDIINGAHLEVEHTVVKDWKEGRKNYGDMSIVDEDFLTLGNYVVTYDDGRTEAFPAMFSLNISYSGVRIERCAHHLNWDYALDPDLPHTATRCDISSENGKVWYKTVMPLSGKAVKCEYVPKAGYEDYVEVKNIKINQ